MLKALSGSSWGQEKETLLLTYNALGKSIASYAAPVWSTNASDSSFKKIQIAQNASLRTETGGLKMASIVHLHQESFTLKVKDHSDMMAPNDTAYKRWSCHSGFKLLCKLCRTSPPPAMGVRFTFFGHAGHADPLDGWRCCSQKRVMSRPIQVRQL